MNSMKGKSTLALRRNEPQRCGCRKSERVTTRQLSPGKPKKVKKKNFMRKEMKIFPRRRLLDSGEKEEHEERFCQKGKDEGEAIVKKREVCALAQCR